MFKSWYRLEGIVTTVDAVLGADQLEQHDEAVKQAAVADRIVLTKCDLAAADAIADIRKRLAALNPGAAVIEAVHGAVDPDAILATGVYDPDTKTADVGRWLNEAAYARDHHGHDHGHHHHHHRHDDEIGSFVLSIDKPVQWTEFSAALSALIQNHGAELLRVKGIVNAARSKKPLVVHSVQHIQHQPTYLPAWPDEDRRTRIVFIVRGLDRATVETALEPVLATSTELKAAGE